MVVVVVVEEVDVFILAATKGCSGQRMPYNELSERVEDTVYTEENPASRRDKRGRLGKRRDRETHTERERRGEPKEIIRQRQRAGMCSRPVNAGGGLTE
jgi:hypothetical protein